MMTHPACPMCAGQVSDGALCPLHESVLDMAFRVQRGDFTDWPGEDHIRRARHESWREARRRHTWFAVVLATLSALDVAWYEMEGWE